MIKKNSSLKRYNVKLILLAAHEEAIICYRLKIKFGEHKVGNIYIVIHFPTFCNVKQKGNFDYLYKGIYYIMVIYFVKLTINCVTKIFI